MVEASASGAEGPEFESCLWRDFSGSSHTSDLEIGTPVAILPGAWHHRVSVGTGRPGVSVLWLGEVKVWSATSISVWQHVKLSVQIHPWDTLACCWDAKQLTNCIPSYSSGVHHFWGGEIFACVTVFFKSNHRGSRILSLWMAHAGCVFVAGIHPSTKWMFVRWNACVHRLDLSLYSHSKEFGGNGVRSHVNSKGKIPTTGCSEEDWTHDAASRRTANQIRYQLSYSGPLGNGWSTFL